LRIAGGGLTNQFLLKEERMSWNEKVEMAAAEVMKIVEALRDGVQASDLGTIISGVSVIGGHMAELPADKRDEYMINLGAAFAHLAVQTYKPIEDE
jgi:hypothetical protein